MCRDRVNDPDKFCEFFMAGFKEQFYFDLASSLGRYNRSCNRYESS